MTLGIIIWLQIRGSNNGALISENDSTGLRLHSEVPNNPNYDREVQEIK